MNFQHVKLIAADMDGTLLNSRHELPPIFNTLFRKMQSLGITFAAASGRQYFNIVEKFNDIHDEIYYIAENGSYVAYQGNDLFIQPMDKNVAREQIVKARAIDGVYVILCGKKRAYIDRTMPEFVEQLQKYYARYTVVDDLLAVKDDDFLKIAICDLNGSEKNSYAHFIGEQDRLQVKVSGKIWLDLSHKLANKGTALKVLQDHLNVTKEETMAFGDYLNDVEMLREAYFSFAMENAHPEVQKAAKFKAGTNDAYGVTTIIEQVLKAKEGFVAE